MSTTLYLIAQILLILLTFSLVFLVLRGLNYALSRLNYSKDRKSKLLSFVAIGLLCWLGILATLSYLGVFEDFQSLPPKIFIAITPTLVLIIVLLLSKSFFSVLERIPPSWLVYTQSYRIIVELILWIGLIGGFVPFQMTFEGFNYDIVVGITALMGGYTFFARGRFRKLEAFIWNIFGIILLFSIVIIATLSTPSPLRVFMNEPANTVIALVPFIWIPGFIVPLALALHLFSLKQIFYLKK